MGFSHRKSPKFYKEKFFFFKYIFGILSTEIFSTKKRWVQIVAIFSIKTFPVSSWNISLGNEILRTYK